MSMNPTIAGVDEVVGGGDGDDVGDMLVLDEVRR